MNTTKIFSHQPQNIELSFQQVIDFTLNKQEGNILEIGVGNGDTSVELLKLCKRHNRRYIAIDPFETNWANIPQEYGTPYPYKIWEKNISQYKNIVTHFKLPSQDASLYELLKEHTPIAFAFVDGIQYKNDVLSDINLLAHLKCPVICVDDFTRNTQFSQVPAAIDEFLSSNAEYKLIADKNSNIRCKAYLVHNSW